MSALRHPSAQQEHRSTPRRPGARESVEGQPVPDLNEIPQARWREVLIPLTKRVRAMAAYRVRMPEASRDAGILTVTLDPEDGDRRAQAESRAARPRRLPAPSVELAPGRPVSRQVNFRISAAQHERLAQAAQRMASSPHSSRAR